MSLRRGGFYPEPPFEKGKPVERPGRKATGLRAALPRQLLSAGLPKERRPSGLHAHFKGALIGSSSLEGLATMTVAGLS
jgi:hypothetical protein